MHFKRVVVSLLVLALAGATIAAQRGGGGYYGVRRPTADTFKGRLQVLPARVPRGVWRIRRRMGRRLSARRREPVDPPVRALGSRGQFRQARHTQTTSSFRRQSPSCSNARSSMVTNHGRAFFVPEEVEALRAYLQKGGFLWADDAWGSYAWDHWLGELRKILPAAEYPLVDLPINHSIFRTLFEAKRIPQIPNIGFFRGTGGQTSEQGKTAERPHAYALTRLERPHHRADDAQHRLRRRVRARIGRSGVLLQIFRRRLRDRDQHPALCDDALTDIDGTVVVIGENVRISAIVCRFKSPAVWI